MLLMVKDQPNKRLIQDLEVDHDGEPCALLTELASKFQRAVDRLTGSPILSFYELQRSSTVVCVAPSGKFHTGLIAEELAI